MRRAFAAGADIKEMKDRTHPDAMLEDFIGKRWETVLRVKKPVIAAVAGFALGGGCELAMMCDFILAADTAKFGQPEINLGVLPGAGGTQRLTRAVGKSKAMDMILTARMMDAAEAERANLVSRVFPADQLLPEALKIAARIAELSPVAVAFAKQAVNRAFETTLVEGVRHERALFMSLFGTPRSARGHGGVRREAEAGVPVGVDRAALACPASRTFSARELAHLGERTEAKPSLHVGGQPAIAGQHHPLRALSSSDIVQAHPDRRHRPQIGRDIKVDVEPGIDRAKIDFGVRRHQQPP